MDTKNVVAIIISRFLSSRYFLNRSGATSFFSSTIRICVKAAKIAQIAPISRASRVPVVSTGRTDMISV